ncbi:MAG: MATE family efflux transporter [Clostridium sp.]|nr:MATE family efflux transporter [Clostridium sp.]
MEAQAGKKHRAWLYDKSQIDWQNLLYGRRALFALLIPVIIEQLLNSLMGMVDTMMVSNVGSEAISAVSLVDSVNNLVIQVFAALAAGATIICAQYLGKKDKEGCNRAAGQVFLTVTAISVFLTVLCISFRKPLLSLVFGKVDEEVMSDCLIYFLLTALSYPFMALFSTGSSLYRAAGNSRFPMAVSVLSNIGNVAGNAIFIFGLHMGVAGAALSTLLSRVACTVVVLIALRKPGQDIVLRNYLRIRPDFRMIATILAVGIPSGIENGMFQFGKLAIQSTVSTMGTAAIAAQAMTIILEMLNGIGAIGIGIGLMTVVGQCIGAGRVEEAKYYIVKLTVYAEIILAASCVLTLLLTKPVIRLGGMEAESGRLCMEMMIAITIVKPIVWVVSFIPGYGMRAAGDVQFSMLTSSATMWLCRVALCIYLVRAWGFGPMAVWIGMFADWTIRSFLFGWRFLSGRWLRHSVLK